MWKAFASVVVSLCLGVAFARIGAAQGALSGIPSLGASQGLTSDPDKVPVPPTPRSVQRILVAQPFTVQTPFINDWSKERHQHTSGTLVVLEMDGAYLVPRNATVGPKLYAGDVPVQRLNHGHLSGRVIGIVPGTVDLATVPLWFGTPDFPDEEMPAAAVGGTPKERTSRDDAIAGRSDPGGKARTRIGQGPRGAVAHHGSGADTAILASGKGARGDMAPAHGRAATGQIRSSPMPCHRKSPSPRALVRQECSTESVPVTAP